MYQTFKDCLIRPKYIASHIDERPRKTVAYFLLLIVIYALPSLIILAITMGFNAQAISVLKQEFANNEEIHYVIEDQKMTSTVEENNVQFFSSSVLTQMFRMPVSIVFDLTGINYNVSTNNTYYLVFAEEQVIIAYGNNSKNQEESIHSSASAKVIDTISYQSLRINNIAFHSGKLVNNYQFQMELSGVFNRLFDNYKSLIGVIAYPFIFITEAAMFLGMILLLAFFIYMLYRMFQLKYVTILKIVALSFTPLVLCNLLAVLFGISLLTYIGQFISVIYALISIRTYSVNQMMKNRGGNVQ